MKENVAQEEDLTINTRHLSLLVPLNLEREIPAVSILNKKNLRTLVVRRFSIIEKISPDQILHFRCLRTLKLSHCALKELPKNIDELILLRYLDLSNNYLSVLPSTIGNLYNLQTLILHYCGDPVAFGGLPKEIGKLGNLRMLSLNHGGSHDSHKFQLRDLRNLTNLRDLVIYSLEEPGYKDGPILNENRNLYSLAVVFSPCGENWRAADQENALETFQRYPNLQYLCVCSYVGLCSPSWLMTLTNLKSLHLIHCSCPEILHALANLQSLETLELYVLDSISNVGPELFGAEIETNMSTIRWNDDDDGARIVNLFPKLKQILFNLPWCCEWGGIPGWSADTPVKIMPRLEYLKLQRCFYLEALPDFLPATPLKHLIIENCPMLKAHCQRESGKEWTKICHAPDIQFC